MDKAVSHSAYTDSSGALLSGVPTIVDYYENLIENIDTLVADATEKALSRYQRGVQKTARKQGWGKKSREIDVSFDPARMEVVLTGDASMEYGTGPEPARPALRASITRVEDLEKMIQNEIRKATR